MSATTPTTDTAADTVNLEATVLEAAIEEATNDLMEGAWYGEVADALKHDTDTDTDTDTEVENVNAAIEAAIASGALEEDTSDTWPRLTLGEGHAGYNEDYITDPAFDGTPEAVREHYRNAEPVYESFAQLGDLPTQGMVGNKGWYAKRETMPPEDADAEADGTWVARRANTFEADFDDMVNGLPGDGGNGRCLYNNTSWKDPEAVYDEAVEPNDFDSGQGLAGYADMRGFPMWLDLDLRDNDDGDEGPHWKRRRGSLAPEDREVVEDALEGYAEMFADVYGIDTQDVACFDSGGGAYLYAGAEATLPIAEHIEDTDFGWFDGRTEFFEELRDRFEDFGKGGSVNSSTEEADFDGVTPAVNGLVPGAQDMLDPDWMQNTNRQSKAPGALHADHDIVVTPARDGSGGFDYSPTRVSEVTEETVEATAEEARKITDGAGGDPEDMARSMLDTLFPEYDLGGLEDWREVIDAWFNTQWEAQRASFHEEARTSRGDDHFAAQVDRDSNELVGGDTLRALDVTPHRNEVKKAANSLNTEEIIRKYAADRWDTSNRNGETTFDPAWRLSNSGESCAVDGDGGIDNKAQAHIDVIQAYALGQNILRGGKNGANRTLDAEGFEAVYEGLREEGYDIPYHVTSAETPGYDRTWWGDLLTSAVVLDGTGIESQDDFVPRAGEGNHKQHNVVDPEWYSGETYTGFPDDETYDRTLNALEVAGIDHGRDRKTTESGESDLCPYEHINLAGVLGREDDADLSPVEVFEACLLAQESDDYYLPGDVDDYPDKAVTGCARGAGIVEEDEEPTGRTRELLVEKMRESSVEFLKGQLEQ